MLTALRAAAPGPEVPYSRQMQSGTVDRWAVLFDLDDTLVETAAIKPLRYQRRWSEVYASYHLTSVEPGVRRLLAKLDGRARTGVVTMAQRRYAETILSYHAIDVPILVAYGDVPRREMKPHPRPILLAAGMVGARPERVVYIGDEPRDVVAATRAGVTAIAFGPSLAADPVSRDAHVVALDWDAVSQHVMGLIDG